MTSMLRDVIDSGTGGLAKELKRKDIVGKTGTTNDVRDSWFAGYQADFVTVAWMGFDDFEKLGRGEEGGRAALGMWVDFMGAALDGSGCELDPPPGMVQVRVDPNRGTKTKAKERHPGDGQRGAPNRAAWSGTRPGHGAGQETARHLRSPIGASGHGRPLLSLEETLIIRHPRQTTARHSKTRLSRSAAPFWALPGAS
jgi:membrane carboxypeptidase/penicillin-binding protein